MYRIFPGGIHEKKRYKYEDVLAFEPFVETLSCNVSDIREKILSVWYDAAKNNL